MTKKRYKKRKSKQNDLMLKKVMKVLTMLKL